MAEDYYDLAAREVLACFKDIEQPVLVGLGNRGGFSGARLWQVKCPFYSLCLKAWPPGFDEYTLRRTHFLMLHAWYSNLDFVSRPWALHSGGTTTASRAGHVWDLVQWMPGTADFANRPSVRRLEAACQALAGLHLAWARSSRKTETCRAVMRRLQAANKWSDWISSGWRPIFESPANQTIRALAERAWNILCRRVFELPRLLQPWNHRLLPHQPCLCDIWHDHVLFEGDDVTGIIDYGSVKWDNVAVDLARLLGSLVGDNEEMRQAGLRAYGTLRPLSMEEEALVAVLDKTGTLLGAANWLKWLYREGRQFEDSAAVVRRLSSLVERIESWENI